MPQISVERQTSYRARRPFAGTDNKWRTPNQHLGENGDVSADWTR
jgi:hypothetical protein